MTPRTRQHGLAMTEALLAAALFGGGLWGTLWWHHQTVAHARATHHAQMGLMRAQSELETLRGWALAGQWDAVLARHGWIEDTENMRTETTVQTVSDGLHDVIVAVSWQLAAGEHITRQLKTRLTEVPVHSRKMSRSPSTP